MFLFLVLWSWSAMAEIVTDVIHSLDNGLIRLEQGRVIYLHRNMVVDDELLSNDTFQFDLDEHYFLKSYKKIKNSVKKNSFSKFHFYQDPPLFSPTVLQSKKEAQEIFERSNPYYKRVSECSDRAHLWAYDEYQYSGTSSMKAFVFFTASYIKKVRFKWWFHVAPMYKVKTKDGIVDYVMDYRYTSKPLKVKEWTDQFVYTKRPCKITEKFSEYDVNPQTENCYLIFESMYYRLPRDIYQKELSGKTKNQFYAEEVKSSRRLAFQ